MYFYFYVIGLGIHFTNVTDHTDVTDINRLK